MPAPLLIEKEKLELTEIVIPIEKIREVCKQRGRLELLDGITYFDLEESLVVGFRDLKPDDWWTADHIPGRPIFPGVLMIEGAAQLCTYHFIHRRPDQEGKFVGYRGVDDVRFRGMVGPGQRITWVGQARRLRRNMFTYATQAFTEGRMVFEGTILGAVL